MVMKQIYIGSFVPAGLQLRQDQETQWTPADKERVNADVRDLFVRNRMREKKGFWQDLLSQLRP